MTSHGPAKQPRNRGIIVIVTIGQPSNPATAGWLSRYIISGIQSSHPSPGIHPVVIAAPGTPRVFTIAAPNTWRGRRPSLGTPPSGIAVPGTPPVVMSVPGTPPILAPTPIAAPSTPRVVIAAPSTPPILPPTPISPVTTGGGGPVTTGVSTACGGYTVCGGHNFCVSLCQHTLKSATRVWPKVTETPPSLWPIRCCGDGCAKT